jgi:nucleoside 2-deoxyribosyltransferase
MKIYFSGSIRGGRKYQPIYKEIINYLKKYGEVLTEHIGRNNLNEGEWPDELIYEKDMEWLEEADVLIAEVSQPSLGVGYEIRRAEELKKKILCLYKNGIKVSAMVLGNKNLNVKEYKNLEEAFKHIDDFFEDLTHLI